MFDAYQVQRALRGHLAAGDALETLARDDATGVFWVLTGLELVLVKDLEIDERIPRDALEGEIDVTDVGITVRLRGTDTRKALVGTFRKPSRLTKALGEALDHGAR